MPELKTSKTITFSFLIDPLLLQAMLDSLAPFLILDPSRPLNEPILPIYPLLEHYTSYVEALKEGRLQEPASSFRCLLVQDENCIEYAQVRERFLLYTKIPPILVKHYTFIVTESGEIKENLFGQERIFFGLQISHPQLYQNKENTILKTHLDPNWHLFKKISSFLRKYTFHPKKEVPFRVDQATLKWLPYHPQWQLEVL